MGGGFRGVRQSLSQCQKLGQFVEANTDLAIIEDDECDLVDVQNERTGYVLELLFEEGDEVGMYVPVIRLGPSPPQSSMWISMHQSA